MSNSVNQQRETLSVTYVWMSVTFCVCLVVSNIFIPRLWQVGPLPVQLTGAVGSEKIELVEQSLHQPKIQRRTQRID